MGARDTPNLFYFPFAQVTVGGPEDHEPLPDAGRGVP